MFRSLTRARLPVRVANVTSLQLFTKSLYSQKAQPKKVQRKRVRPEKEPRIRYLFMTVLASFALMHFVTTQVDKKKPAQRSFTEREFQQYEKETGLKRRHKLITHEKNDQYTFYVVPYCHDITKTEKELMAKLPKDKQVKVVDIHNLIEKEVEDEKKYCYLLQDLKASGRSMPRGLLTALVKEEIQLFMNTTKGQFDTSIVILNYPQSTEEAIKFENDVSDIKTCIKLDDDLKSVLSDLEEDDVRKVKNVFGYFDTVDKVTSVTSKVKAIQ